ncbi:MAG: hypothetical protein U0793_26135 [Gemmataceae bacterium]
MQNLSDLDRSFEIDHVIRPEWTLAEPGAPAAPEKAARVFSFSLPVAKEKVGVRTLVEEHRTERDITLRSVDADALRALVKNPIVNAELKAQLGKLIELGSRVAATTRELAELDRVFAAKSKDQERTRSNLSVIPATSEHYKKFLDRFVTQEQELETMQRQITTVRSTLARQEEDYRAFADGLNME